MEKGNLLSTQTKLTQFLKIPYLPYAEYVYEHTAVTAGYMKKDRCRA